MLFAMKIIKMSENLEEHIGTEAEKTSYRAQPKEPKNIKIELGVSIILASICAIL